MGTKKVSVIIPTFNSALFLPQSIESILKQTYKPFEIIVVDDGSTDDTKEKIRPYFDSITYYYKNNGGPASARNFGIRKSEGELVAFLDADDMWLPDKLSLQIEYIKQNQAIGAVFAIQMIRGVREKDVMKFGAFVESRMNDGHIFDELLKNNFIGTSTIIVKREILDRTGLFDEDRKLISVEDINLWLRIARYYKFGFINKILGIKSFHADSLTLNFEQMYNADIYNFRKLAISFPEWELNKNRSYYIGMGNYYYGFGDEYFSRRLYSKARRNFFRSLFYLPRQPKLWIRLILSFLPSFFVDHLRDRKG